MRATDITRATARLCSAAVVSMAASPHAAAFGGVGYLGECTSFTTCTAAVGSGTWAFAQYRFSQIGPFYQLPFFANPVVDGVSLTSDSDLNILLSAAPIRSGVGADCSFPPCLIGSFTSSAHANAQSGFAVNRAEAASSFGASGSDYHSPVNSADVRITTGAESSSAWRDAWTFSGDGHFSATIHIDGVSSNRTTNGSFPSTYTYNGVGTSGSWYFDLWVWDVDHLSFSEYFEDAPGPTLVTVVRDSSGPNEQRPSFSSDQALDFDFTQGVHYVVTADLGVQAGNGRTIDLFNTARLQDVTLSGGAVMTALSGHDYLAPVPEPTVAALLAAGLAVALGVGRRRR